MHTPGPWERSGDLIGRFIEGRRNWTHVAAVDGDTDAEREANSQLIAAAPEMLAALERAREVVNAVVLSTHSVSFDADLRAIDLALESARGTTPLLGRNADRGS